jgi:hypothetical protein
MDGNKYSKSFVEPKDMFVGCGRVTGNTEVKRSKRRLATTRSESRTRFALCRLAVYIQPEPRARLTLPDLATDDREFTWVDTPDLKYFRKDFGRGPMPATSIRKKNEH